MKEKLSTLVSGRKAGPLIMLAAMGLLLISILAPLSGKSTESVAPDTGLPSSAESARVQKIVDSFPNQPTGTTAFVVYSPSPRLNKDGEINKITDEQFKWISGKTIQIDLAQGIMVGDAQGRFDKWLTDKNKQIPVIAGEFDTGVNLVLGLDKLKDTTDIKERIDGIRAAAREGMPAGLQVQVTGPEAIQADVAKVFEGANFLLLTVTFLIVMLLLVVTYRSPILWIIPIVVVGSVEFFAKDLAGAVAKLLDAGTIDGSISGILSVLVLGVGTDYAFLLISRYREELAVYENRREAMAKAWLGAAPAILASGVTVVLALSSLLLAENTATRTLGIACATGVAAAMVAALFVLPAAIVLFGRWIFWPARPKLGDVNKSENGIWGKLAKAVSKRPVIVSVAGAVVLVVLAISSAGVKIGLSDVEKFQKKPESVVGIESLVNAEFSVASAIVIANDYAWEDVRYRASTRVPGVLNVDFNGIHDGKAMLTVHLIGTPGTPEVQATISRLRAQVHNSAGADAIVGGLEAQNYDLAKASEHDRNLLIPIILLIVFGVLVFLLRSLVAPILLLITVIASYFAALGAGWLVFTQLLGFRALDLSVYLFSFLFLVALGIDYNIFLATRAREESATLGVKQGMIRALATTGGVITSAGVLLAAVFAVLGVLPLIALLQIGIIVCIGVLLDTLLVRTVIVPALAFIVEDWFWWPSKAK